MRASLLGKAGAVALTVGIAMSGAAGVANASTAPHHRLHTTLAVSATAHKAEHMDVLAGHLRSNGVSLPSRWIVLERTNDQGKWIILRKKLTDRSGAVRFVVAPKVRRHFKLVFRGSRVFAPSTSPIVVLKPVS